MREGYAVMIAKYGETILTIEQRMLSGADLSKEDEEAIRGAAAHLLAFIGNSEPLGGEFEKVYDDNIETLYEK